jgi:methionyl-tRNA synthetase
MNKSHVYVTTPIFYASGNPHAGHIYATALMNILCAHYSHRGVETRALTGMDEHGEKIEESAKKIGIQTQRLVDDLAEQWKQVFSKFGFSYDVFMRTTSEAHKNNVTDILKRCHENGDIYFGEHEGHYCVGCEAFLTSKEMDDHKNCLIHQRPTELRREGNYYFRVQKYLPKIIDLIKQGKIVTQRRYVNELVSMAESFEGDLSISRPKSRTSWGIELPFDTNHVAYVWFDALPNYVTGVGGVEAAAQSPYWKSAIHVIGRDILKFHGLFWPAMLLSLGLEMPELCVTGWLLSGGHKMSKSLGNVITPDDIFELGRDAFINSAFRLANPGEDVDLTHKSIVERYNADLANGVGNLASRTLTMIEKYFEGNVPDFHREVFTDEELEIARTAAQLPTALQTAFDQYKLADALQLIWDLIARTDKYIASQKPWELAKTNTTESMARLANVLAHSTAVLRTVGFTAAAFFPEKMKLLLDALGEENTPMNRAFTVATDFYGIRVGFKLGAVPRLFQRMELPQTKEPIKGAPNDSGKTNAQAPEKKQSALVNGSNPITIEDFGKVEICIATVLNAELVEGSTKLLRLKVSVGDLGLRQILSGIREWITPEELVNRKVLVATNLAPRKMKFGMSEGMLLSAESQTGQVTPVFVPDQMKEGSRLA